jgi:hypothetical protein
LLGKAMGRRAGGYEFLLFCNREKKDKETEERGGGTLEMLSRTHET